MLKSRRVGGALGKEPDNFYDIRKFVFILILGVITSFTKNVILKETLMKRKKKFPGWLRFKINKLSNDFDA